MSEAPMGAKGMNLSKRRVRRKIRARASREKRTVLEDSIGRNPDVDGGTRKERTEPFPKSSHTGGKRGSNSTYGVEGGGGPKSSPKGYCLSITRCK